MSEERSNLTLSSKIRNRALLGTAAAVVLGGVLCREAVLLPKSTALADAVRVEGVQPVSFADVVEKVRPAVVTVQASRRLPTSELKRRQRRRVPSLGESGDFPKGAPMETLLPPVRRWRRCAAARCRVPRAAARR